MANANLKLQIQTALDNAGIKATKEQIEGLEKSLSKLNDNNAKSGLENKWSKLPGPIGKLNDLFGGLSGTIAKVGTTATAVIGAFKVGWDIGSWLQEKVINPLFGIKEPLEELKKKNKELQKQHEKTMEKFAHQQSVSDSLVNNATQSIDQQISHIDKMSAAWKKATTAKMAYANADKDMELQLLERHRFEDIMQLEDAGDLAGAEQANKLYDVYKAMIEAKKQMAQFDAETANIEKELADTEDKRWLILEKIAAATKDVQEKEREQQRVEEIATSEKEYRALKLRADQKHYSAVRRLRAAEQELEAFDASDTGQLQLATRAKERMTLADKLNLGIDQAAWDYDKNVIENGNSLQIKFEDDFKMALAQGSKESADALAEAVAKGVEQGVGALLELKK